MPWGFFADDTSMLNIVCNFEDKSACGYESSALWTAQWERVRGAGTTDSSPVRDASNGLGQ